MYETDTGQSALLMPLQAGGIDRTPSGAAAFGASAGVEASAWWDDVRDVIGTGVDVAKTVAPLLSMFSDVRLKRDIRPI